MSPHLQLLQTPSEPVSNPSPVQVISWYPSRPWRGPAHQSAQLDNPLYLQGQLWSPHHLSLGVWGWGSQPAHQLVVRQAGQRLRLIRSFATKHPLAPSGLTCRPRLLPLPASEQSVAETLHAMEVKWVASMRASSRGTARLSSEMSDSLPAWMTPSQTSRVHRLSAYVAAFRALRPHRLESVHAMLPQDVLNEPLDIYRPITTTNNRGGFTIPITRLLLDATMLYHGKSW